jgi:hypothetical protein
MSAKAKKVLVLFSVVFLLAVAGIMTAEEWSCYGVCAGCTLNCENPVEITECCGRCDHSFLGPVYCCYPSQGCHQAI